MDSTLEKETKIIESLKLKEQKAIDGFMGTTSFHGLIQAYHHKNKIDKLSWFISLLICTAGLIAHLYLIVNRYIGLPTTIDMISSVNYDQFPSVTICPNTFISREKLGKYFNISQINLNGKNVGDIFYNDSLNFWISVNKEKGKDINNSAVLGKYWDEAETSFYRFQRQMNISTCRRNFEMIFFCEINNKPCSWNNFAEIDHPTYKRCFKFIYPLTDQKSIPDKLILGLYVDDDYKRETDDIKTIITSRGGKITINEANVYPGTESSFEQFPSGYQTNFRLKQEGSSKVNKVRSPCEVNSKSIFNILNDYEFDGTTNVVIPYKYNVILCRQYYQQIECVKRCKCLNPNIPVFADVIKTSISKLHFCNEIELNSSISTINKQLDCLYNLNYDKDFQENVISLCPGLCDQTQYSIYSYTVPWFEKTMIKEMNFVNEKFLTHYNSLIDSAFVNDYTTLNSAMNCVIKSMNSSVQANLCFSLLIVQFDTSRKEIIREYSAYLLGNLLSDFGGILGLWIGMSLITIIELIHLTCSLSKHKSKRAASIFRKSINKRSLKRNSDKNKISRFGIENEAYIS